MKQYENYKDSGMEWLGDIPSHWDMKPLGHIAHVNTSSVNKKIENNQDPCLLLNYMDVYRHKTLTNALECQKITATTTQLKTSDLQYGDLLFTPSSETPEDIGHSSVILSNMDNILFSYHLMRCRFYKNSYDYTYLSYYTNSISARSYLMARATGITRYTLSIQDISTLKILLPPIKEQKKISSYLDSKIGNIDNLISKKKKQAQLLTENRKAIIHDVVTKGLDPNVKLKDTHMEYLGKIPIHWEIHRLQYLITINNGQDYKHIQTDNINDIEVIGSGGVFAHAKDYLYNGKALLLGRKGTIDNPLYVDQKFWAVDTIFYCTSKNENTCIKYLYYISLNFPFMLYSTSTALPSMAKSDLETHKIQLPPLTEQQEIVKYLDRKTSIIDELIFKINKSIELLEEYKISLISHIVSGKIKL